LEIMWHTYRKSTIDMTAAIHAWLCFHPWLVSVVPLDSFPVRGHVWYRNYMNWPVLKHWMPPNAEEIIEEQEIERRICGGSP